MNRLLAKKCRTEYFNASDTTINDDIGKCIIKYLSESNIEECTPVILCIGTDRATGDCLGPLVGEKLLGYHSNYIIMGCLRYPVHALNIRATIDTIRKTINNPFVIAIDASLGSDDHVGYVTVSNCPISPGKGVNKKLPAIGDVSITGIVNMSGKNPGLLQNTRLHTVMQLADCIADSLKYAIDYLDAF